MITIKFLVEYYFLTNKSARNFRLESNYVKSTHSGVGHLFMKARFLAVSYIFILKSCLAIELMLNCMSSGDLGIV